MIKKIILNLKKRYFLNQFENYQIDSIWYWAILNKKIKQISFIIFALNLIFVLNEVLKTLFKELIGKITFKTHLSIDFTDYLGHIYKISRHRKAYLW